MTLKVFITGASSGIGAALAMRYAARGATLGLVARRAELLEALSLRIGRTPGGAIADVHVADVTDAASMNNAAQAFMARHGVPDLVVACAGISRSIDPAHEAGAGDFAKVLATNTVGTLTTFQPFIVAMRARGIGKLVGIASVAGLRGLPGASAYSASKAAVIAFCESLRIELRGTGVEVLTLCPGYVRTAMSAAIPYKQPFLIDADVFASRAIDAIAAGVSYAVIPRQMAWMARLMQILPNALYDPLMKKARPQQAVGAQR
jgi:short-subunit dehydrogenase